jgi:hypothetical protein
MWFAHARRGFDRVAGGVDRQGSGGKVTRTTKCSSEKSRLTRAGITRATASDSRWGTVRSRNAGADVPGNVLAKIERIDGNSCRLMRRPVRSITS